MQKRHYALVLTISCLLLSANGFSLVCPKANAIKKEGLIGTELIEKDRYFAYNLSNYRTRNNWGFALGIVQGTNPEEALEKANASLQNISGNPSPVKDEEGFVSCTYSLGDDSMFAIAYLDNDNAQLGLLRRLAHIG